MSPSAKNVSPCRPALDFLTSLVAAALVTILSPLLCLIVVIALLKAYHNQVSRWERKIGIAMVTSDQEDGVATGTESKFDGKTGEHKPDDRDHKMKDRADTHSKHSFHDVFKGRKGHDHEQNNDDDHQKTENLGENGGYGKRSIRGIPTGRKGRDNGLTKDQNEDHRRTEDLGKADDGYGKHSIRGIAKGRKGRDHEDQDDKGHKSRDHGLAEDQGGDHRRTENLHGADGYSKHSFHGEELLKDSRLDAPEDSTTHDYRMTTKFGGWVEVEEVEDLEVKCQHSICKHDHDHSPDESTFNMGKSNTSIHVKSEPLLNKRVMSPLANKGAHSMTDIPNRTTEPKKNAQGSSMDKNPNGMTNMKNKNDDSSVEPPMIGSEVTEGRPKMTPRSRTVVEDPAGDLNSTKAISSVTTVLPPRSKTRASVVLPFSKIKSDTAIGSPKGIVHIVPPTNRS